MNNKIQNILLGTLVIAGIVLCAMLLASSKGEKNKESTPAKKPTNASSSTAAIVNMPTAAVEIRKEYAVVTDVDVAAKSVTFRFLSDGKDYYFKTDEPVFIYSAYDSAMTLAQLNMGNVVKVEYDAESNRLNEIRLTNDATCHRIVTDVTINTAYNTISFYNKTYEYVKNVIVVSNDELITPDQLVSKDVLMVYEMDNKVVSIIVTRGHGYLTLTGVDLFMDGYVNIGNDIIKTIKKDMMLMVTEGSYKVSVSHNGYYGAKTIKIERDKVTAADFSEIVAETVEYGNVLFEIDASGAKLYLNGEETAYSKGVLTLPVGTYSVRVSAAGYENYVDKLDIIADYQKITINMTPDGSGIGQQETTEAAGTTQGTQGTETTSSPPKPEEETTKVSMKNRVYIDGPAGAIIYFDNSYVGIAPLNIALVTGEHTFIVLTGSEAKSYTVNLAEGADDVRYDFTPKSTQ